MVILVVLIMMMLMTEVSKAFFIKKKNFKIKSPMMVVMMLTWKRTAQTSQ